MYPLASWIIALWMSLIGGVIGSFLNVVVYRLPLGMSIVHPPSHCPKCGKLIRWFDNVPVFGWLFLRGRCRQCGNPISPRYPIVEAITAGMFGLLAVVEFMSDAANLPHRAFAEGDALIRQWSTGYSYGIYLFHLALLCTLWCAALIEYDGQRAPRSLFMPAMILGLAAPLYWPWLRPVAAWGTLPTHLAGTVDALAGLAAGALIGGLALLLPAKSPQKPVTPRKKNRSAKVKAVKKPTTLLFSLLCVGTFLGWQAVLGIAIITAFVQTTVWGTAWLIARSRTSAVYRPTMFLLCTTVVWILVWARINDLLRL